MDEFMDELKTHIADLVDVAPEDIDEEEELIDQGLNSLRLVEVVTWLRTQGHDVDFTDLAEDTSLVAWHEILAD
ncbi:phosphopantetheine-binding protein [Corynebacterium yudongzhengii]|nr:phosphopantetheine-binding protein [Corynebacterium yudongzhengii]